VTGKNLILLSAVFFLSIFFAGCAQVQVSQDYAIAKKPASVSTFSWLKQSGAEPIHRNSDPLLHDRFVNAISDTLAFKGIKLSNSPDILVTYKFQVVTKIKSSPSLSYGVGGGPHGRYSGLGINSGVNIKQYNSGQLFIDLINGKTNELFWRGIGTRLVFTHNNPEKLTRDVYEMVDEILRQFPSSNTP
jgi:hypothetical protein